MRPPYRTTFENNAPGIGDVEADVLVTPGLPPRYGEDPDPGHDTEYEIGDVRIVVDGHSKPIDPDHLAVPDFNGGWQRLTDYLVDRAPSAIGEVQP